MKNFMVLIMLFLCFSCGTFFDNNLEDCRYDLSGRWKIIDFYSSLNGNFDNPHSKVLRFTNNHMIFDEDTFQYFVNNDCSMFIMSTNDNEIEFKITEISIDTISLKQKFQLGVQFKLVKMEK